MDDQEVTSDNWKVISTGEWVLYIFLFSIPVVNIIMLCVWAFGRHSNPTKTNFGRAGLIWVVIYIVLYIIFGVIIFGIFSTTTHHATGLGV
jgi:heme/copper-type cytochrome/quinol oxidase subunit 2